MANRLGFYHKRDYLGMGDCPYPGPGDAQPSPQPQVRDKTHGFTSCTHAPWLEGHLCGPNCKATGSPTGNFGTYCWRRAYLGPEMHMQAWYLNQALCVPSCPPCFLQQTFSYSSLRALRHSEVRDGLRGCLHWKT